MVVKELRMKYPAATRQKGFHDNLLTYLERLAHDT